MGINESDDLWGQWRRSRKQVRRARQDLSEAEASAGLRATLPRRTKAIISGIGAALIAVAVVGIWFWASAPTQYSDADYLAAATSRVDLLLNVDANDPDRARRILTGATGEFHDSFAQSADAYTTYVKSSGAHGKGTVDAAAVSYRSNEGADIMIAANVQVTKGESTTAPAPIEPLRLLVSMVPEDGVLKISGLVLVP
ncbi:hypothetical protein [Gordonia sp. (in: high G+C Gram-positive bacteria)]|uniref:hypothetical protein n=1 Tax=Gordonia sp. (in: high G+C Gram-positive bacteria) TaxID=84139 RepID=UPI003C72E0FF